MSELAAAIEREAHDYIAGVIAAVAVAEKAGFKPLGSDEKFEADYSHAYYQSRYSIGPMVSPLKPRLFRSDRHPYLADLKAVRGYFSGDPKHWEFIRHQYTVASLDIVIMENVNDVLVLLPGRGSALAGMVPAERVVDITRIAASLFAKPWSTAKWHVRGSASELDEIGFTTAPMVPPDAPPAGRLRMDAGVWQTNLYFLYYKTHNEQMNSRRKKGVRWFTKGKKAKR